MMKNKKQPFNLLAILALLVLVCSFIKLGEQGSRYNVFSVIVSILGITACITYFLKNTFAVNLLYAWLLAQVIIIEPYYFVNQFPTLNFMGNVGDFRVGLNLVPLLLFFVVRFLISRSEKAN